jgi:hypothetical protein
VSDMSEEPEVNDQPNATWPLSYDEAGGVANR